jgi:hypothetical protein
LGIIFCPLGNKYSIFGWGYCNIFTVYLHGLQVMRSITDNITEEKLLEEIDEISLLPMYADRMQQAHTKMAQQQRRRLPPQC